MRDPFIGTWKLNPARSSFDPNHRPTEATMRWTLLSDGSYEMRATGTGEKGEHVEEKPQILIPDGKPHPVPNFAGLSSITTRPNPHTIEAAARREDGTVAGEGRYVVSGDGATLSATTAGLDSQLRRFEMRTEWDRVDNL